MDSSLVLLTQAEDVHQCHEVVEAGSVLYVDLAARPTRAAARFLEILQRHPKQLHG